MTQLMAMLNHRRHIINSYWTKPSPLSKDSMLPKSILGDGEAVSTIPAMVSTFDVVFSSREKNVFCAKVKAKAEAALPYLKISNASSKRWFCLGNSFSFVNLSLEYL